VSRKPGAKPHGQIRRTQIITTFGPGSMVDLPNHSVLIAGLDHWSKGGEEIVEPRLVEKLQRLLELPALKLYSPPPDEDKPDGTFFARALPRPDWDVPWMQAVERVVLVHRLREVVAQVGFTRFEAAAPDIQGELEMGVSRADLAREPT